MAESIEHLFSVVPATDVRPTRSWRNREVVARCRAAGFRLSESHLSELRRGVKSNPTLSTLTAIAWFFDVPLGYFSDPQRAGETDVELAARREAMQREQQRMSAERRDAAVAASELDAELKKVRRSVRARPRDPVLAASDRHRLAKQMRDLTKLLQSTERPTAADWRTRTTAMQTLTNQLRSA